jgi:hypothetical protein
MLFRGQILCYCLDLCLRGGFLEELLLMAGVDNCGTFRDDILITIQSLARSVMEGARSGESLLVYRSSVLCGKDINQ